MKNSKFDKKKKMLNSQNIKFKFINNMKKNKNILKNLIV